MDRLFLFLFAVVLQIAQRRINKRESFAVLRSASAVKESTESISKNGRFSLFTTHVLIVPGIP
jgi:hypothetical protein